MKITPNQYKALLIIRDHQPSPRGPSEFGLLFFGEDHPGWFRYGKAGSYGSTKGVGMNLASGAYLGKLRKAGLISWHTTTYVTDYHLTRLGEDAVREYETTRNKKEEG